MIQKTAETLYAKVFSGYILPAAGLEPARGCPQQILSLPRLPFRHAGICPIDYRTIESVPQSELDCKNFLQILHIL